MSLNETHAFSFFVKGRTLTQSTGAVSSPTTKKAVEKTAAVVADNLGTVAETVEVALEVPSKVVMNQKLVVAASVVVGTGLGVAGVFGYRKFQEFRRDRKIKKAADEMTSVNPENS